MILEDYSTRQAMRFWREPSDAVPSLLPPLGSDSTTRTMTRWGGRPEDGKNPTRRDIHPVGRTLYGDGEPGAAAAAALNWR